MWLIRVLAQALLYIVKQYAAPAPGLTSSTHDVNKPSLQRFAEHKQTAQMRCLYCCGSPQYPGLDRDVKENAANCEPCATHQKDLSAMTFILWPIAHTPWQRIHINFGRLQGHDFLMITDSYSKWPEVQVMKSAEATTRVPRNIFVWFGLPCQLVSDNGPSLPLKCFNCTKWLMVLGPEW